MLSINIQNLRPGQIKSELKELEAELLKATRELLDLEKRYRAEKIESLAKMEAHEARLGMLKSMLQIKNCCKL